MIQRLKPVKITIGNDVHYAIRIYWLCFPTGEYVDLNSPQSHSWCRSSALFKHCLGDLDKVERVLNTLKLPTFEVEPVNINEIKTERLISDE